MEGICALTHVFTHRDKYVCLCLLCNSHLLCDLLWQGSSLTLLFCFISELLSKQLGWDITLYDHVLAPFKTPWEISTLALIKENKDIIYQLKKDLAFGFIHLYLEGPCDMGGGSHSCPASLHGLLVLMHSSFFFPLMKLHFLLSQMCLLALLRSCLGFLPPLALIMVSWRMIR